MMRRRFAWILVLLGAALLAGAAWGEAPAEKETPRRQVIDLDKLRIEGRVPHPSTLFIRERNSGSLYELFPLRRRLSNDWLRPVFKGSFDEATLSLVDRGMR